MHASRSSNSIEDHILSAGGSDEIEAVKQNLLTFLETLRNLPVSKDVGKCPQTAESSAGTRQVAQFRTLACRRSLDAWMRVEYDLHSTERGETCSTATSWP